MAQETPVILLVEGDIVARYPLAHYLRQCGFVVIEAVNADEAKTALKAADLRVSVVLANTKAAGVGFALLHWTRAEDIDVRVILSPSVERLVNHAGALCNAGPALAKPYEHHLLLDQIRQAMARRERALRDGDKAGAARYA